MQQNHQKRFLIRECCRINRLIYLVLMLPLLSGCIGGFNTFQKTSQQEDPSIFLAEKFRRRAIDFETQGELQHALACWQVVYSFKPGDPEILNKIVNLKTISKLKADLHFQDGLKDYRKHSWQTAQTKFLMTLRYNPNHTRALNFLKSLMPPRFFKTYRVQKGDTFAQIAAKIYNDPDKGFLIAYFNELEPKGTLIPGTILKLPVLEGPLARPLLDIEKQLALAKKYLSQKKYNQAISITEKILTADPQNLAAADLQNDAYYQAAKSLQREQKYTEALQVYKKVDRGYKDVAREIFEVTQQLKKLADINYRIGVNHFVNEELGKAIEYWEKTLTLYPDHPKAKEDIKKARQLLEKLKKVN